MHKVSGSGRARAKRLTRAGLPRWPPSRGFWHPAPRDTLCPAPRSALHLTTAVGTSMSGAQHWPRPALPQHPKGQGSCIPLSVPRAPPGIWHTAGPDVCCADEYKLKLRHGATAPGRGGLTAQSGYVTPQTWWRLTNGRMTTYQTGETEAGAALTPSLKPFQHLPRDSSRIIPQGSLQRHIQSGPTNYGKLVSKLRRSEGRLPGTSLVLKSPGHHGQEGTRPFSPTHPVLCFSFSQKCVLQKEIFKNENGRE